MKKFMNELIKEIAYYFNMAFSNLFIGLARDLRKIHGIKN